MKSIIRMECICPKHKRISRKDLDNYHERKSYRGTSLTQNLVIKLINLTRCILKAQTAALLFALTLTTVAFSAPAQTTAFSDKDKSFLKDSTEDNLGEVKIAELVVKTSKNPQVTAFARKMIADHTALNAGAKPVAAKAGVTPPTSTSAVAEAEYLKLKVLSGETFDKSYVKTMVSDHHDDLNKIKEEHDSTRNPDMKMLTAHAGQVVATHTKMIDALAGKMGLQ